MGICRLHANDTLGLVQSLGDVLQLMQNLLWGATMLMFGSVAAAGLGILGSLELNRRQLMIIGISLGLGLGPSLVPGAVDGLPTLLKTVLGSAAATAELYRDSLTRFAGPSYR